MQQVEYLMEGRQEVMELLFEELYYWSNRLNI